MNLGWPPGSTSDNPVRTLQMRLLESQGCEDAWIVQLRFEQRHECQSISRRYEIAIELQGGCLDSDFRRAPCAAEEPRKCLLPGRGRARRDPVELGQIAYSYSLEP